VFHLSQRGGNFEKCTKALNLSGHTVRQHMGAISCIIRFFCYFFLQLYSVDTEALHVPNHGQGTHTHTHTRTHTRTHTHTSYDATCVLPSPPRCVHSLVAHLLPARSRARFMCLVFWCLAPHGCVRDYVRDYVGFVQKSITGVAFSPDSNVAYTVSLDGNLRVWDIKVPVPCMGMYASHSLPMSSSSPIRPGLFPTATLSCRIPPGPVRRGGSSTVDPQCSSWGARYVSLCASQDARVCAHGVS
jgi:WD40 repeat protein